MATKKSTGGKSMDIQKAGEATPDSTARPIIVSNRPMLQDPMVTPSTEKVSEPEKDDEEKPAPQSLASSAKTIEPSKDVETSESAAEEPAPVEPEKAEEPEDEKPAEVTDSISSGEDSAVVDAVLANSNQSQKSEDQKQEEEDAKRKQAVQVLVDSKKYFVPVGQVSRRKHNQQLTVLLILLIAAAAGFFAVTTGLVTSPVAPALDFFKQLI